MGTQGVPRATQNHNMGVFMKRIKIKMIRCYHRCKNKIVYAYKRVRVPFVAFLMCFSLLACTLFACKQTAYATGVEEMLYYTYWDLINSIYSVCGYESKTDVSVVNNHGVTGKQAWDNFVTFVENSAKANYKFVGDGMSKAFSELENLVYTVTEKGFSMTQDLYDMLKSVFADQVISENNSLTRVMGGSGLSKDSVVQLVASICGTSVSSVISRRLWNQMVISVTLSLATINCLLARMKSSGFSEEAICSKVLEYG